MSTVPLPPDYYEHQNEPPRRNWKKIAAWIISTALILMVGLFFGLMALLQNSSFRQYLLRTTRQQISDALGTPLRMKDFGFRLSGFSPTVDMYDVVIDAAPPASPPFLQVDHMSVGVQVLSLMQRKWYLRDIAINHPVARILVDENGVINFPATSSRSQTSIFDLGIRHVMLERGEIYYNDQKSTLDADLHDLEFQSTFNPVSRTYSGGLTYHNGRIHLEDLNPLVHSLEAEFDATPDSFALKSSMLKTGASQLSFTGTLNDYANPKVSGTYQASLNSAELRQVLKDESLPVGVVQLAGSAQYQSRPNQSVLQTLSVDGNVSSAALQVRTETLRTLLRDISARYVLKEGNLDVRDLRARVLGGRFNGSFNIHDVADTQESELHARLQNIALANLQTLTNSPALEQLKLGGTANAKVDATWHKTFDNLVARTDADVKAILAPNKTARTGTVPVDGEIHAQYNGSTDQVSFTRSYFRMPHTFVNLHGTVSKRTSLQVQFQSDDLHELEAVADVFAATPQQPFGLYGRASFVGTVQGSSTSPQISGQFSSDSLKVKGTEWRALRTSVNASPSHLALRNGYIQPASRGRILFNADLGLDRWTFMKTNPIQIQLDASDLNVAEIKNLAGSQMPVAGTLSANVSLRGTQSSPVGEGAITLTEGNVWDEPVQLVGLNFQGNGDDIKGRVSVRMPAGSAQGSFTYKPKDQGYTAELDARNIRLDQFHTVQARNLHLAGTLGVNARGSGTLGDPGLQLTAQIPQLQIHNQVIKDLTLQASVANRVANVAIDSQALDTYVRGHGTVHLTGSYDAEATFDTSTLSLQPLAAMYLPAQAGYITGQTEVHLTLKGPLKDASRLDGHVVLPKLAIAYKDNIHLAAVQPIHVDYAKGVLKLERTSIRGTGTDLQLQGTVPLNSAAPVSLLALGTIDLRLAQMLDPDILSSGQVQFNIDGYGHRTNPALQGQIKIVNASFAGDGAPLGLQDGNGVLSLTNDRLEIEEFHGRVSGGTLTAAGGLIYRPSLRFNLSLAGNGLRLLFPRGVREAIDTNMTLTGSPESALLRGQVRLNELSFSPNFDIADIAGQFAGATTVATEGLARNIQLEISVNSTNDLNLVSSKLSLQGVANLRVRGTAAEPVVLGRVNVSGGDLIFRGNRYLLLPSSIDFVNPFQTQPILNLAVDSKVQEYNIHLLFRGTVDQIRTTYSSDPALPPADIINLLVFGKTTEATEANPTPGNLGAQSLIASSVSNQVTNRIEKVAGISQLSIDPILGGASKDMGARVTLQQRVTGNLFVTFATDATSTQHEVIKLEYQATPRLSVSGVRDQNGGFALDLRMKKTW